MIHVVTPDVTSDRILARLARHLVVHNGWTVDRKPRADAEWNVFIPYLEWRRTAWTKTPTAAWFTHYEPHDDMRARCWQEAAEAVTLRVSPAVMYVQMLERYGPTAYVPHPVEIDKFTPPDAMVIHDRPVIGVAGYTYPSGRKGEHLVAMLTEEHKEWRIKAAGQGWPCECHLYEWRYLQRFYQSLDVFLCTSLIEGGPVTVLEALATDLPVVIPRGVGACDDLPDLPGIYHYAAGNYESMVMAIEMALSRPRPIGIRYLIESSTPERFARMWARAIEATTSLPAGNENGVFSVAYGEAAKQCVRTLIRSLRKVAPDLPIAVASDDHIEEADFPIVYDGKWGGRAAKLAILELAPASWGNILYCDADTIATASPQPIFDLLRDGWDAVFVASPYENRLVFHSKRDDRLPEYEETLRVLRTEQLIQPSGGVWAIRRNARVKLFMERWHNEWEQWGRTDQLAFARALHSSPVRYILMGEGWNCYMHHQGAEDRLCGFAHFATAAREWGRGDHPGRKLWEQWNERI